MYGVRIRQRGDDMARIGKYSLTSQADGLALALLVVEPEGEPVALVQLATA